jgi:7,8-dihydropterin-6-yl-methyl-4-(beta-D-ribofuranosyl)aminobenzene 5'-phosphate synthase
MRRNKAKGWHATVGSRVVCVLFAMCFCTFASAVMQHAPPPGEKERAVTVTILYDNYASRKDLQTAWGFACFIEGLEKNILFDTGGDPDILLSNMEKLGVSPEKIQVIFLSHIHGDHTGGLAALLEKNPSVTVFLPASFPEKMKGAIREKGAKVVEVKEPTNVCQGAFSTGEMGTAIKEQGLCVRVKGGIAVITGCAHPGVVEIVTKASEFGKAVPQLVMGGFHMTGYSEKKIGQVIADLRKLGVVRVGPCHCSGDRTRKMFSEAFGDRFIRAVVGAVVELQPAR